MSSTPLIARDACTSTASDVLPGATDAATRPDLSDGGVLHHHGHAGAELGANVVHGPDGHAVPLFSNLPLFCGAAALASRINELLAARKTTPEAADALEQLTVLNDALGRVLVDPELGIMWGGVPIRGCDLLSAMLPPQSPGRTHDALLSDVKSLVGCGRPSPPT
jgi:hypothetical protein